MVCHRCIGGQNLRYLTFGAGELSGLLKTLGYTEQQVYKF